MRLRVEWSHLCFKGVPTTEVLLVTGSSGPIGSEVCSCFHDRGWAVHGVDNNQRAVFIGADGGRRKETNATFHLRADATPASGLLALRAAVELLCDELAVPTHHGLGRDDVRQILESVLADFPSKPREPGLLVFRQQKPTLDPRAQDLIL